MKFTRLNKELLFLLILLLSSCSYLPFRDNAQLNENVGQITVLDTTKSPSASINVISPAEMNKAHLAKINTIDKFLVQARIAVQTQERSFSGATRWQHQGHTDDIAVLSPLGGQIASIKKNIDGVQLKTSDGKILNAKNVEDLTAENLGWRLPLSGLSYWIIGRPSNKLAEDIEWDFEGRITKLSQDGWKIEYTQYTQIGDYWLPKKILLLSPKLNLKLVVQDWSNINSINIQSETSPATTTYQ